MEIATARHQVRGYRDATPEASELSEAEAERLLRENENDLI